jgi:hypothetical protein
LLRALTDAELQALRRGLACDDPALQQGLMTLPPPLECLHDWQVEAADLLAYPAWRGRGLQTVKEVEEAAWALCSAIDARLGEGAAKELLAWYDATPRADVLAAPACHLWGGEGAARSAVTGCCFSGLWKG